MSTSLVNASIGPFVVRELIGAGGIAEVFRVEHQEDRRCFALKVIRPERQRDKEKLKSFQDEFVLLQKLQHPSIPVARRSGEIEGRACFVMDLIPGDTFAALQAAKQPIPGPRSLKGLVEVVAYVHDQDLIHNDIKLENAFLRPDGGVSLIDFGNVKRVLNDNVITRFFTKKPSQIFGTATYLAPELIAGKRPTLQSDLYAIGVCAFLMLTGKPPFDESRQSGRLRANLSGNAPSIRERLPAIPPPVAYGIDRCLAKAPEERPAHAGELLHSLKNFG
ncbi:MAG: serine/threonine protein kinase [Planctomycetes bacterium]|nr:serine/threonine protein kinase [Planctomycetota bacterium]